MIVVAIIGILAAIAIPNFIRFQARARQSEVHANLKSLFTGLRTQQRMPPGAIRATSFAPERGNRYSYHLENACSNFENRNGIDAIQNDDDTCIGVDTFTLRAASRTSSPWCRWPAPLEQQGHHQRSDRPDAASTAYAGLVGLPGLRRGRRGQQAPARSARTPGPSPRPTVS